MPTTVRSLAVFSLVLSCFVVLEGRALKAADSVVAAAANLNHALSEVAAAFVERTGTPVRLSFGSSGNIARQIVQGAPYGMFLSADEGYVERLSELGLTEGPGDLYAIGRIVLFAPHGSSIDLGSGAAGIADVVADGRIKRFAIANPEHAPYGRAARQVLVHLGVWKAIHPRLVIGENASQTTQFAVSGSTEGGLIPYSQALTPFVSRRGEYALVPQNWHAPLRQRMVLLKGADDVVERFYDFVGTPPARAILERYGFEAPGDASGARP